LLDLARLEGLAAALCSSKKRWNPAGDSEVEVLAPQPLHAGNSSGSPCPNRLPATAALGSGSVEISCAKPIRASASHWNVPRALFWRVAIIIRAFRWWDYRAASTAKGLNRMFGMPEAMRSKGAMINLCGIKLP
jgi:hypothetical protein